MTVGLQDKFEEYLLGYKIDVRTILRSYKGSHRSESVEDVVLYLVSYR